MPAGRRPPPPPPPGGQVPHRLKQPGQLLQTSIEFQGLFHVYLCQVRKTSQAALLVLLEQGLVEKLDVEEQASGTTNPGAH